MKYDKPVTLQLRPHVADMLSATVERVQARLAEQGIGKRVSASAIIRNLLRAGKCTPAALRYAIGERIDAEGEVHNLIKIRNGMAPYVALRVRMAPDDVAALHRLAKELGVSTSRAIAALIASAQKDLPKDPDWELLQSTETQSDTTTEDTHD